MGALLKWAADHWRCAIYNWRLPAKNRELLQMWHADAANPRRPKFPPTLGRLSVDDLRWGRAAMARIPPA